MKVLVTGGAGYVGNQLVAQLLEAGHDVTAFDNFTFGYDSLLYLAGNPRLQVVKGDIRSIRPQDVCEADCIFHLAAISGYSQCEADPGNAWAINVDGTARLIDAMFPSQLLIFASSTSIWGPPTLYARSKEAAEAMVMQRANSIAIRWATLFGVGPRMRHELLPNAFARQAVQRGHIDLFSPDQRRTFMHVATAAHLYTKAMELADKLVGQVWDVGDTGLTCTKRELAEHIAECVPCSISVNEQADADGRDIDVDFSKAAAIGLGYKMPWWMYVPALVNFYKWYEEAK